MSSDIEIPNSQIWRGGYSTNTLSKELSYNDFSLKVYESPVTVAPYHPIRGSEKGIYLYGKIASKGGGFTCVYLFVPSESFDIVRKAMRTARKPRRKNMAP